MQIREALIQQAPSLVLQRAAHDLISQQDQIIRELYAEIDRLKAASQQDKDKTVADISSVMGEGTQPVVNSD